MTFIKNIFIRLMLLVWLPIQLTLVVILSTIVGLANALIWGKSLNITIEPTDP